jgi:hypothetical protein
MLATCLVLFAVAVAAQRGTGGSQAAAGGRVGGFSVLPLAVTNAQTTTIIEAHDAGSTPLTYRVLFFKPDGTLVGRSNPQRLSAHATASVDLRALAANLGLNWATGPVHFQWVASSHTQASVIARFVEREPDATGAQRVRSDRLLPLDDYGPTPVSDAEFTDVAGAAN